MSDLGPSSPSYEVCVCGREHACERERERERKRGSAHNRRWLFGGAGIPRHPRTQCVEEQARDRDRDRETERECANNIRWLAIWWCMRASSPSYTYCVCVAVYVAMCVCAGTCACTCACTCVCVVYVCCSMCVCACVLVCVCERECVRTIAVGYLAVHACLVILVRIVCMLQQALQCDLFACVTKRIRTSDVTQPYT